jgi:class 3 adenylate cyclase/predicted ATPase
MDLGGWLRSLGLEQYEAAFRENEIDVSLLPNLTAEDLKDLGVSLVGHRRKLLDAIATLGHEAKEPRHYRVPMVGGPPKLDPAERRQVTVMFCDLVGSTALAARMDPEDLREVITTYQKCVSEIVRRYEGFVARYLGDGVLIFFGYPNAHEDDAERAVRAGLKVVDAVSALQLGTPLQTRVGIATGMVVVGDLLGGAHELDIVGETPNLAARLQTVAEPDMVAIADSTRRLVGNLFELRELGVTELKGIGGPVRVWAALRASSVESRFEALRATDLTALVGREEETELLEQCWSKARSGEGQVVLISGEAGIGKSRLTTVLMQYLASEQHVRLRYFCSPQHTNSAFYPIIGHIERAAGLAHDDPLKAKLDKLDASLTNTSAPIEDVALFAEMLSLPNDGRYPSLQLTPQQRRHKTLKALIDQVARVAKQAPVLMVFEDAHWADPTSQEAISRVVERVKSIPALLVITFRPEFKSSWGAYSHVTSITLPRLGKDQIALMVAALAGNKHLPMDVMTEILDRSDGIPLFAEEMTKAVLEADGEVEARRTVAAFPSSVLSVPASLHASLMARLDRLGSAKKVAQIGAAIGREFSHALIAAVVRGPRAELSAAMKRLVGAGLLSRRGVPPHVNYLFKHALVQDAAYGTLLREQRRELHARIAEALETQFADIAERQPELLARHCEEAGLIEKAARYWAKAGQRSLARSALVEAAEQLTRTLNHIASLPSTPALRGEQIKLQVALVNALMHVKGYAAPEPKAAVEQARQFIEGAEALGEPPEDPLLLFSVLYGGWAASYVAFDEDVTCELASQFMALAEKQGQIVPLMIGHRLMGTSLMLTGDLTKGRSHFNQAFALYDRSKDRSLATRFGQDVGVSIFVYRALAHWMLGYPESALADADHALENAREGDHAGTLMYAQLHTSFTNILCAKYAAANEQSNEVVRLADEKGAALWKALGTMGKGCVLALSGKASESIQLIASGITTYQSTGSRVYLPFFLSHLSWAHAKTGQLNEAWRCICEAVTAVETTKERWYEAEINRIKGEIALKLPQLGSSQAEAYFERALTLSRAQGAKSWELRAAMSLARLWRDQRKHQLARELLAPICGWFTEGFDTLDLMEAKALLEELAS